MLSAVPNCTLSEVPISVLGATPVTRLQCPQAPNFARSLPFAQYLLVPTQYCPHPRAVGPVPVPVLGTLGLPAITKVPASTCKAALHRSPEWLRLEGVAVCSPHT